jgi:FG-GAP-like repeat
LDLPACFSAVDFNGDGKPDLLIAGSNLAEIALGNGDGTFQLSNPEIICTTSYVGTNGVTGLGANLHADSKVDAVISIMMAFSMWPSPTVKPAKSLSSSPVSQRPRPSLNSRRSGFFFG